MVGGEVAGTRQINDGGDVSLSVGDGRVVRLVVDWRSGQTRCGCRCFVKIVSRGDSGKECRVREEPTQVGLGMW